MTKTKKCIIHNYVSLWGSSGTDNLYQLTFYVLIYLLTKQ